MKNNHQISCILGVNVNNVSLSQIVNVLIGFAKAPGPKTAFYLNAHCANVAYTDSEYREILNNSDLVYPGGQAIVWASRFLGPGLTERVNILDFFEPLAAELKQKSLKVFLLGGEESVVKETENKLKEKGINIVGSYHGYLSAQEEKRVLSTIKELKPDILIVGMGVPLQEKWIDKHKAELGVNLCWGVGAAFDWLSGERKRAPKWMIRAGLEWAHRLYQQPLRLWRRYIIGNPLFLYRFIVYKIKRKTCG